MKVVIGKPMATTGLDEKDAPALMEKTLAEMRKYPDPEYNPFEERFVPPSQRLRSIAKGVIVMDSDEKCKSGRSG